MCKMKVQDRFWADSAADPLSPASNVKMVLDDDEWKDLSQTSMALMLAKLCEISTRNFCTAERYCRAKLVALPYKALA